jgi:hypothetical protein
MCAHSECTLCVIIQNAPRYDNAVRMLSGPLQGRTLAMVAKITKAKTVLEVYRHSMPRGLGLKLCVHVYSWGCSRGILRCVLRKHFHQRDE